ncbi:MAG: hypothetical protein AB7E32_10795 [Desulfovibrio sp.]
MARFAFSLILLVLPLLAAPALAGPEPGTPEYAAQMVYEGGHSLNYAMMIEHACMSEQERDELKAFFESQIAELRAAGVDFDKIGYDFSKVEYTLLEQDADLARVEIRGPYAILSPTGPQWDEDPDLLLVQRIDGHWKMCGDQTRSNLPLSDYRLWMKDPAALAGEAPPEPGASPEEVARAFCEAVYRIDAEAMEANMCKAMRDSGLADMAQGALREFESMGVDWSEVKHDFSGLRYELVRQEGGMAEVRLTGMYKRTHSKLGGEEQQENQVFTLKAEDGRWVVCE